MKNFLLCFLLLTALASCAPFDQKDEAKPQEIEGLRPIYLTKEAAQKVESLPPQAIKSLGKIYYKAPYIYVNESNLGVHVINNSDPANPLKFKFLSIPGCRDIAIKGNILYADNAGDLIAVDISDLDNPIVTKRLPGLQGYLNQNYPELYEGYFECPEEGKGVVIGWEEATLTDPQCWR